MRMPILLLTSVMLTFPAIAADRIQPTCTDSTDANGKSYHSCRVIRPEAPPTGQRLVPAHPPTGHPLVMQAPVEPPPGAALPQPPPPPREAYLPPPSQYRYDPTRLPYRQLPVPGTLPNGLVMTPNEVIDYYGYPPPQYGYFVPPRYPWADQLPWVFRFGPLQFIISPRG